MRSAAALLATAFFLTLLAGCGGTQGATEARENPNAVEGEQRTVLRGTAMRERSAMGTDLIGTLRAATENPREATSRPSDALPARFTTFLTALDEAGLADLLRGEGPYTLFAPTDAAFQQLSAARRERLFQPENREQLRELLRYHVIEGNFVADELAQRSPVTTLSGEQLVVRGEDAGITINGTRVRQADAGAANGTLHVIETLLMPPSMR